MAALGASRDKGFGRQTSKMKTCCSKCLEEKPVSKLEADGYEYICSECKEVEQ